MECYYKRYVFIFYLFFTTIRIIVIKIVFHHGELVNVSQSEAIEASGVSTAPIILFMCLEK